MKRLSSISAKLFKSYALLFGLFFSIILFASLIYVGVDVNQKLIESQETAFDTVVKNTETFFTEMHSFSKTLSNSEEFRDIVINELPRADEKNEYQGNYFNQLYLIGNKMLVNNYRIGVQLKSGKYIWLGSNYFINDIDKQEDFPFLTVGLGNMAIQKVEENQLLKSVVNENPYSENDLVPSLSLKRDLPMYYHSYAPVAILDIQVPYSKFEKMMDDIVHSSEMNITVYNGEGQVLYGNDQGDIEIKKLDNTIQKEKYEENGKKIQIEPLMNSNIYVVGSISAAELYRPLIAYLFVILGIFLLLTVGLLFFTYRLSVKLTNPIKLMCQKIRKIDFDGKQWTEYDPVHSDIQELNFLSETIVHMQNNLKISMSEAIQLRAYEIQSRMLALQAQMQPHFLYNTLMTISAMAEEKDDREVAHVCDRLTRMLRYISSEDARGVTLSKELKHSRDYVEIMKERFPETQIEYDIPLPMMGIVVPKLIIQPLIENSLKYCDRLDCKIRVFGEIEEKSFKITITDNGIGFTDKQIEDIMNRCYNLIQEGELSTVKIDGMGLANIYARLHLFYGKNMLFKIYGSNEHMGGSRIEIGGTIF